MWVLASGFGLEGFQLVGLGLGFWAEGFLLVGLGFGIRARGFPACRVWVLGFWACLWVWASGFGFEGPACGFGPRVLGSRVLHVGLGFGFRTRWILACKVWALGCWACGFLGSSGS
jgi:hypothetical protein